MPQRKRNFVNEEIHHVILKRIGNELLFRDTDDYYRGVFSIYEFNTSKPTEIYIRRRARIAEKKKVGGPTSHVDERKKLVKVLAFALMPNHIHLLLKQLKDNGITNFVKKIGSGYPLYFRKKHNQTDKGYFFKGRFASIHVKSDSQLIAAFAYIHTNPLSLIEPGWKGGKVKNPRKAIEFLEKKYRWSSHQDYLGKKNFPSVTDRDFLLKTIGGQEKAREIVNDWIKHKKAIKGINKISLE
ncbi:transposase [Candidatus Parcubacteria bacterium]|nr:transposase [Patescibacteria group bacterium]MBU4467003.1 transposase [Patescibacteria group bacterium]MCG2688504.1 transposase [Candidatus Parcubacteria bacterium]